MKNATLYGIPNCDTVRKARKWLSDNGIAYDFVDLRADTPSRKRVNGWLTSIGSQQLINRRSATYKQLSDSDRGKLDTPDATAVLIAHPTLIKRPVLEWQDTVSVGFIANDFAQRFAI